MRKNRLNLIEVFLVIAILALLLTIFLNVFFAKSNNENIQKITGSDNRERFIITIEGCQLPTTKVEGL